MRFVQVRLPEQEPDSVVKDMAIPLGIVGIVLMMVLPLPAMLIDVLLAVSIAIAIGVFLIVLFMEWSLRCAVVRSPSGRQYHLFRPQRHDEPVGFGCPCLAARPTRVGRP